MAFVEQVIMRFIITSKEKNNAKTSEKIKNSKNNLKQFPFFIIMFIIRKFR